MASDIRVRLAPSPTGKFHIGTARTALFNFLFAKRNGGVFVLRMEDTDKERSEEQYTKDIIDGLLWLGLGWDEGPEVGGAYGPYFQQEREEIYDQYIQQLLSQNKAYRCYCTHEELDAEREIQQKRGEAPRYSGKCRHLTDKERADYEHQGRSSVVRFAVEPQTVVVEDLIRGKVEYDSALIGDFVIARSDGSPLFVFTNTVDDDLMKISHVLRGEEHLPNTAKQILLAQALNFLSPQFGHLPLILNPDRSKMSKRKNPVSISDDYRAKGFLPEAIVNYIALLGWSSGTDRELYSLNELIDEFQIERVGKSPSIFDQEKLLWMNGYYIRNSELGKIANLAQAFIRNKDILKDTQSNPERYMQAVALVQDRMKTLVEIEELIEFFYVELKYKAELLIARKSDKTRTLTALKAAVEVIEKLERLTIDESEVALRNAAKAAELKDGELLWAVRVALTGKEASPGTFELLEVFGKEESLKRLAAAIKKLSALKN